MRTTGYHEDLLDQYPQPLAATYARYLDQPDTTAQHAVLLALFEALLKYTTVAALAQYLHDGGDDPALHQTLAGLRRPSLGHWAGLLRQILAYRRQQSLSEDTFV